MQYGVLIRHCVRFRGPRFTHRTRESLSAAGIYLVDRQLMPEWGDQVVEYVVSVDARDEEDAVGRVSDAVAGHGHYTGYVPDP